MEDYKYKLSIIIPMYNAEKYIVNCLESILNSDLPTGSYEIIIINDGSSDNGPCIAKEYETRFANIVYLTQENQGQSVARNLGIRACHGEYIWCVDSDDKVGLGLSKLMELLICYSSIDIMAFGLKVISENGDFVRNECTQPLVTHNKLLKGCDAIIAGYSPSSVCALWIRHQFIEENNLFFKEGITHQDVELSYRLFSESNDVLFADDSPYIYILHPDSTSQSINPSKKIKYLSDDIIVYQSFMSLSRKHEANKRLSATISNRAQNVRFGLVLSLFHHRRQWRPLGINRAVVDRLKENGLYPLRGPFDNWKKTLFSKFLNIESLIV